MSLIMLLLLQLLLQWTELTTASSLSSSSSSSSTTVGGMILRVRRPDGSMERILVPPGQEENMTLEQLLLATLQPTTNQNDDDDDDDDENNFLKSKEHSASRLRIGEAIVDDLTKSISDLGLKHGSLITILMGKSLESTNKKSDKSQQSSSSSSSSSIHRTSSSTSSSSSLSSSLRWDPFPDLAKDYDGALRQWKRLQQQKRHRGGGVSSYTDLAQLQSNLHIVEPQPHGPIHRVYMCRKSAERFQANCIVHTNVLAAAGSGSGSGSGGKDRSKQRSVQNRVGLLLGSIQRERREQQQQRKARTSLSSLPSDQEYCQVAKVHAIWEPPQGDAAAAATNTYYDASALLVEGLDQHPTTRRVLELAQYLGLSPIGWIFTYSDDYRRQQQQQGEREGEREDNKYKKRRRNDDNNNNNNNNSDNNSIGGGKAPLVLAPDVITGAKLEMAKMKYLLRRRDKSDIDDDDECLIEGKKFVTLAMDATTGATEAFQLSDVSVQMVSEGILLQPEASSSSSSSHIHSPFVPTRHPILVDGQETSQLDVWLCLINTALLGHDGDYCNSIGSGSNNPLIPKKNKLTTKTKKAIRKALEQHGTSSRSDEPTTTTASTDDDHHHVLHLLSDFSILVALDSLLTKDEMKRLCQLVHKYVRGQKRGTKLDANLQRRLKSVLSTT